LNKRGAFVRLNRGHVYISYKCKMNGKINRQNILELKGDLYEKDMDGDGAASSFNRLL
jgi:hypothetical protein